MLMDIWDSGSHGWVTSLANMEDFTGFVGGGGGLHHTRNCFSSVMITDASDMAR